MSSSILRSHFESNAAAASRSSFIREGSDKARHRYSPEAADEFGPCLAKAGSVGNLGSRGAIGSNFWNIDIKNGENVECADFITHFDMVAR